MTSFDNPDLPVKLRRDGAIAHVLIDRPERKNALSLEIKRLIAAAVTACQADDAISVVMLSGAGGCFVAGTDIAEMETMTPTQHVALATDAIFHVVRKCPKIMIAAIEGYALGGGCELALCCDLIIAGESAKLGQPEIRVGIMPGGGGTQRFVRLLGKYRALKYLLTGEMIPAPAALQMGLLSEVVADGSALARATELAKTILSMPPLAVRAIKEAVDAGPDMPLDAALAFERKAFVNLFDSDDQQEGMRAFLEKRRPVYRGS